ncbi:MAG: four helix bundle protein [Candidatus Omnitrophica bacterium]|nr:four helix bundle protein [Candidatus Omnitrophota bacterium]
MTQNLNPKSKYDLEERTAKFGEEIIKFCMDIPKNEITKPIINQLVKCGTSVGANYSEADDAESKADFRHKIGICKKESRECKHFLRMSTVAVPEMKDRARILWKEAQEINLIFNAIYQKVK